MAGNASLGDQNLRYRLDLCFHPTDSGYFHPHVCPCARFLGRAGYLAATVQSIQLRQLYCYGCATGSCNWSQRPGYPNGSKPNLTNGTVKSYLQSALGILIALVFFGACTVMPARSDYTWVNSYTQKATSQGWKLVYTQKNYIDITRPWTIFNHPPVGLYFIKPGSIKVMPNNIRQANELSAHRSKPPIEESEGVAAFDCQNRRFGYLQVGSGPSKIVPDWTPVSGEYATENPAAAMLAYVCAGK